jgi:hypothetical protein
MTVDGESNHWNVEKVETWLKVIADGAGIPVPPADGTLMQVFAAEEEAVAA